MASGFTGKEKWHGANSKERNQLASWSIGESGELERSVLILPRKAVWHHIAQVDNSSLLDLCTLLPRVSFVRVFHSPSLLAPFVWAVSRHSPYYTSVILSPLSNASRVPFALRHRSRCLSRTTPLRRSCQLSTRPRRASSLSPNGLFFIGNRNFP